MEEVAIVGAKRNRVSSESFIELKFGKKASPKKHANKEKEREPLKTKIEKAIQDFRALQKSNKPEGLGGMLEIGPATHEELEHLLKEDFDAKLWWVNGRLFIKMPTTPQHETVIFEFTRQISNLMHALVRPVGSASFDFPASQGVLAFNGQPDGSWIPRAKGGVYPCPTLILEVGYGVPLADVHSKAMRWLGANTEVQIVLVIQIYKIIGNAQTRLLTMRYHRGVPVSDFAVSFGDVRLHHETKTALNGILGTTLLTGVGEVDPAGVAYPPCNAVGIADYQLKIPNNLLYAGIGGILHLAPPVGYYMIDLFYVQTEVITSFQ